MHSYILFAFAYICISMGYLISMSELIQLLLWEYLNGLIGFFLKLIIVRVYIYFNCVVINQKTLLLVPWAKARTQYYWDAESLNTTLRYIHTTPRQKKELCWQIERTALASKVGTIETTP